MCKSVGEKAIDRIAGRRFFPGSKLDHLPGLEGLIGSKDNSQTGHDAILVRGHIRVVANAINKGLLLKHCQPVVIGLFNLDNFIFADEFLLLLLGIMPDNGVRSLGL